MKLKVSTLHIGAYALIANNNYLPIMALEGFFIYIFITYMIISGIISLLSYI